MADLKRDGRDADATDESDEIKVTDRRLFTRDGVLREGTPPDEDDDEDDDAAGRRGSAAEAAAKEGRTKAEVGKEAGEKAAGEATRAGAGAGFERRPIEEPEGVDFTMLINAMAQPALIFLGEIAYPGSEKAEVNLEQARLQIDLLDLLRIRCRGNMSVEEEGLLDRILYQLRMLYVARSSSGAE